MNKVMILKELVKNEPRSFMYLNILGKTLIVPSTVKDHYHKLYESKSVTSFL